LVDYGSEFPRPGVLGERTALVADFRRKAQSHRPVPFLGHANAGTNMVADPLPALAGLDAGKDIKPGFEPRCEPICDFKGFMQRMIRREYPVHGLALSMNREIAV